MSDTILFLSIILILSFIGIVIWYLIQLLHTDNRTEMQDRVREYNQLINNISVDEQDINDMPTYYGLHSHGRIQEQVVYRNGQPYRVQPVYGTTTAAEVMDQINVNSRQFHSRPSNINIGPSYYDGEYIIDPANYSRFEMIELSIDKHDKEQDNDSFYYGRDPIDNKRFEMVEL